MWCLTNVHFYVKVLSVLVLSTVTTPEVIMSPDSLIQQTMAHIGAYLHEERGSCREITKIFENPETGLVVYKTDVFDDRHQHDWRWYTIALPNAWDTTPSAKAGHHATLLGKLPFKEVIETTKKIILVFSDGHQNATEEFLLDDLRSYDETP